jgi:60 kDa SS-A/Ro ribonucleoprotein
MSSIAISPCSRLDHVVRTVSDLPFGGTDCALPMIRAAENEASVDIFRVYTDSETWAGDIHPVQALRAYRHKMGIGAKLVVLDVVGVDTATPSVIADFATRTWSAG